MRVPRRQNGLHQSHRERRFTVECPLSQGSPIAQCDEATLRRNRGGTPPASAGEGDRGALAVESAHNQSAERHGKEPVGGIDGKEIGAAALKNMLGEERGRHKA